MTTPQESTVRVFIALDISPEAHQALAQVVAQLRRDIPHGVRWVRPEGIHLTLKFLGNIPATQVDPVVAAMRQAVSGWSPFSLELSGLGMFPDARKPRVLWGGVAGDLAALQELHSKVDAAVSALGFAPEKPPFRPHLTLGRPRDDLSGGQRLRVGETFAAVQLPSLPAWRVDAAHLIRSNLQPGGAIYTSIGDAKF